MVAPLRTKGGGKERKERLDVNIPSTGSSMIDRIIIELELFLSRSIDLFLVSSFRSWFLISDNASLEEGRVRSYKYNIIVIRMVAN